MSGIDVASVGWGLVIVGRDRDVFGCMILTSLNDDYHHLHMIDVRGKGVGATMKHRVRWRGFNNNGFQSWSTFHLIGELHPLSITANPN